ncbi:YncE family protein [Novosphingobium rosa]|uniref:YncE family protein n=1 Tax=Novosphingobium rosa TaxID=76978 RepID=UPI000A90DB45|nr:YncE family protein [Novosphingobium rosa]
MTTCRTVLHACTLALMLGAAPAMADTPVATPLKTTLLPEIEQGGFDHFAVDLKDNLLFITAEVHKTVEMFRLSDGAHLGTGTGYGFPHTPAYAPRQHQLFVADGDKGAVFVIDVPSLKIVQTIPLRLGADEAVFDSLSGLFYVGCGGAKDSSDNSAIAIIDTALHKEVGRIPVASTNIESMAVDHERGLLYVNLRDKKQIAVIDLKTRSVKALWDIPGLNMNTPLLLDTKTRRLFIAGRKPGMLFVVDAANGHLLSTTGVVETADGATYDEANKRLYISGAEGLSVLKRVDADHFEEIQRMDTHTGKVSIYEPSLRQLYVAHARTPTGPAALDIYAMAPASKNQR